MGIVYSDIAQQSNGGTEILCRRLEKEIDPTILDQFQIIPSRLRGELDESKIRIFWAHDCAGDPESDHLKDEGWRKYHRLVFVSHWQMQNYIRMYNIPWSRCQVILNAIDPIKVERPNDGKIRLIYHTTPHRGLAILAPVFKKLAETHKDIHLDVFSSFMLYGWKSRDKEYQRLFDELKEMDRVTYHGTVSSEEVRAAVGRADIFAYPSIWEETSCMCLMEAMSAGLICVHPSLGALPETAANWSFLYQFNENPRLHAGKFHALLELAINKIRERSQATTTQLQSQSGYANVFYNWQFRKHEWLGFLESLLDEPREFEKVQQMFSYST
jgi:glycosyltransferase involved in cell wall biosynthesis